MSRFRNFAAFLVAITALVVGSVAANYALQLKALTGTASPTPEPTKAATLAAKGPGAKTHLEVTDFKFGEPFIEKTGERWDGVWLPLIAPAGKASAPAILFHSTRIHNQAQLDEVLAQKSLRVFVTNSTLRRSVWGATGVSKDLYLKYPKLDFDKLTLLTEPDLEVPLSAKLTGKPIVFSTDTLMSAVSRSLAWGVCGGAFLLGVLLTIVLITPTHRVDVVEAGCRTDRSETGTSVTHRYISSIPPRYMKPEEVQKEREKLLNEHPATVHQYKSMGLVSSLAVNGLVALGMVGVFGAVLYGTSRAGPLGPVSAAGMGFAGAAALMFFVYYCKRSLARSGKSADVIQTCTSGIRWQLGKQVHMAVWSEIAYVERVTYDVNKRKQGQAAAMGAMFGVLGALAAQMGSASDGDLTREGDAVTVQLQDGHVMHFSTESLTDYVAFASTLHEQHGNEAKRFAGGIENGVIARAFIMPGAASRATMFNRQA